MREGTEPKGDFFPSPLNTQDLLCSQFSAACKRQDPTGERWRKGGKKGKKDGKEAGRMEENKDGRRKVVQPVS